LVDQVDPSLEYRWKSWVENALGGSQGQNHAATAAAVGVVRAGGAQAEAIRAARQAWAHAGQPGPTARAYQPTPAAPSAHKSTPAVPREHQPPPPQPREYAPAPAPARAPRSEAQPSGAHRVQGRVTGFSSRTRRKTQTYVTGAPPGQPQFVHTRRIELTVWSFWVEPSSSDGERLGPIAVEMTGRKFRGTVTDGDEVRIDRRPRGKKLRINKLENLTTAGTVRAKGGPLVGGARVIVTAIQLAVLVGIVVVFLTVVLPHLRHLP
jgi:hypothetical protein